MLSTNKETSNGSTSKDEKNLETSPEARWEAIRTEWLTVENSSFMLILIDRKRKT